MTPDPNLALLERATLAVHVAALAAYEPLRRRALVDAIAEAFPATWRAEIARREPSPAATKQVRSLAHERAAVLEAWRARNRAYWSAERIAAAVACVWEGFDEHAAKALGRAPELPTGPTLWVLPGHEAPAVVGVGDSARAALRDACRARLAFWSESAAAGEHDPTDDADVAVADLLLDGEPVALRGSRAAVGAMLRDLAECSALELPGGGL